MSSNSFLKLKETAKFNGKIYRKFRWEKYKKEANRVAKIERKHNRFNVRIVKLLTGGYAMYRRKNKL